jgi:alkaline phosphatase
MEAVKPIHAKVKIVIMIIGDGMELQQVGFLLVYARQAPHSVIADRFG